MRTSKKLWKQCLRKNPVRKISNQIEGTCPLSIDVFSLSKTTISGWWFQPHLKNMSQIGFIFPNFSGWKLEKKIELPPPSDPIPNLLSCFFEARSQVKFLYSDPRSFRVPWNRPKNHTLLVPMLVFGRWGTSNQNVPKINNLKKFHRKHLRLPNETLYTHCETSNKMP